MKNWDVIVIGGGMVGLSTTYQLARLGARVLLLQKDDVGGGTSAANAGRAQVSEGSLDSVNLQIVREGVEILGHLEEELEMDFEWHRLGYLCLIKTPELWDAWVERSAVLTANGIPAEMMDVHSLRKAEPLLNTDGLLGAAYALEGLLNPFRFCWAYARAARRLGAEIRPFCAAEAILLEGTRVVSVEAGGQRFHTGRVVVTAGAWTPQITRMAGVETPIRHTHAEAFITERVPSRLHNTIGLADFYEIIHGKQQAVAIGVGPHRNDSLLVTEAVRMTDEYHRKNSIWGISGVAADLIELYPGLSDIRVTRAWGSPTPFTPDDEPLIGWLPQLDNVFVAASFKQTITGVPLVSQWISRMVLQKTPVGELEMFSPARFGNDPA